MQNAQNAAEIQERVINLVELYRTKVGKESEIAKEAKEDYEYWEKENQQMAMEAFDAGLSSFPWIVPEGTHTEGWVKTLRVNEQLLGHFYQKMAGKDADTDALSQMLPDFYDCTVYTQEEENFLMSHFREMVNYIVQTPTDGLKFVNRYDSKDRFLIPDEVLDLVASRIDIKDEATIYNPFAGFAQFATLYKSCKFYCEESYEVLNKSIANETGKNGLMRAWMTIALFANGVDATIIKDGEIPTHFDAMLAYIPFLGIIEESEDHPQASKVEENSVVSRISSSYKNLKDGGTMALLIPSKQLYDNEERSQNYKAFGDTIVKEHAIAEIIQLPTVMNMHDDFCLVVIKKGQQGDNVQFIDARFAGKESEEQKSPKILSLVAFSAMLNNDGKECVTGLRKKVSIPFDRLQNGLLLPQVYVVETPLEDEYPVPLSQLCTMVTSKIGKLQFDLPESTPWINMGNLTALFIGELDMSTVEKAGCPNNPTFVEGSKEYAFSKSGKFIDSIWAQMKTKKGYRVAEYRNCTYLDGNHDAVLLKLTKDGIGTAIVRATGAPAAVGSSISVLVPKKGVDILSLIALLRLPVVTRQIIEYERVGLDNHLNDILVPTDKRIINDEIIRMLREQDVVGDLETSLFNIRRSVRMRKHALTQSLSSIEAMFYALNAFRERKEGHIEDDDVISRVKGTKVKDAFEYLSKELKGMMPVLEHIADVEYTFAKPEWIDPELFIEDYIARKEKGWLNFKPIITWKEGHNQTKKDIYIPQDEIFMKKGQSIYQFFFPKDALERVFKNIISNAQAWAFNDASREDYQLRFSWHIDDKALVIEIENNGTPIPDDRDTASLLEYGVSTDLHHDGHNGIGCNEIDDIMQRYDGKVEIVSFPKEKFTVKYILTFYRLPF